MRRSNQVREKLELLPEVRKGTPMKEQPGRKPCRVRGKARVRSFLLPLNSNEGATRQQSLPGAGASVASRGYVTSSTGGGAAREISESAAVAFWGLPCNREVFALPTSDS